jgi:hypothetical protein
MIEGSVCHLVDLSPHRRCSRSYGGGSSSQWLVIAAGLLLVVVLVLATATLDCSACIKLATLPCL